MYFVELIWKKKFLPQIENTCSLIIINCNKIPRSRKCVHNSLKTEDKLKMERNKKAEHVVKCMLWPLWIGTVVFVRVQLIYPKINIKSFLQSKLIHNILTKLKVQTYYYRKNYYPPSTSFP
jgi:hypothetical protein